MELYESLETAAAQPEAASAQEINLDTSDASEFVNADDTVAMPQISVSETEEPSAEVADSSDTTPADDSAPPPLPEDGQAEGLADSVAETAIAEAAMVRVKFNKREHTFTTEQAAPLVEMGLKWEQFRTHHEKLRYLAQENGQSVGELIDTLLHQSDEQLFERLREECGGSEAAATKLLAMQQSDRQRQLEQAGSREAAESRLVVEQEQAALEQRLADEFVRLTEEMPGQFSTFTDVPPAVVDIAVRDNVPLMDACLRFEFYERQRVAAVRERQAQAAGQSAGRLSGTDHSPDLDVDSFERAFYSALR